MYTLCFVSNAMQYLACSPLISHPLHPQNTLPHPPPGIQYPAAPYNAFVALVNGPNGMGITWSNPSKPVNVLCTGKSAAASMVPLCGVWAALTYPQAHVLVEAFNATWPASVNGKFNWTLSQIVEQTYVWADDTDKIGKGRVCVRGGLGVAYGGL